MQSWHAVPDGSDPDNGHGSWPSGYEFPDQTGQYDNSAQTWSQPLPGQPMYTSIASNPASNTAGFFPNSTPQGGPILSDAMNGVSSVLQDNFAGQGGLPQFRQEQDTYNIGFESLQHDGFGQQGKLDLGQGLDDLTRAQPHQAQTSPQGFGQNSYALYPPSNDQTFGPGLTMPAPSKVLSGNAPALDRIPQQAQPQQQPPQQRQHPQQQQLPQPQHQPPQQQQQHLFQHVSRPQSLEHIPQTYSPAVTPQNGVYQTHPGRGHPLNQQQAQLQSHAYLTQRTGPFPAPQGSEAPQDVAGAQHASTPTPAVQRNVPQSTPAVSTPPTPIQAPAALGAKHDAERVGTPLSAQDSSEQSSSTEPAPKKRKRVLKKAPEPQGTGMPEAHSQTDVRPRKAVETDKLPLPGSNEDELALLDAFKRRRSADAMSKFPPLPGAPCLAMTGTIKLPTPKSYDKLAPLVAMPSQSGKPIMPEMGRSLPCEIQGAFSAKFKPSPDGAGLEDRKREAKDALAEYDRAMEALGNHRPKYTEYPHALQEQLKADGALRTKAERLAKKLAEEERNKPVRSETRPSDPVEGAVWDIIGYVHIPPSATRTTSLLAGAVQQAGEYIMARRGDMARAKLEVDQATKDKAEADLPSLTAAAELKKEVLYRTLEAANKVGDEVVLENLGGHGKLVLSLVNLLITCIKAGDFSGKLPKAALYLMANFRMTRKVATQTNFDNIRRRLADKGDAEVKDLLETITSRIRKEPDADASPKKPAATSSSTAEVKTKPAVSKPSTEGLSTKRARVDDTDSRATKKQAVESSVSSQSVAPKTDATTITQSKVAPAKSRPTGGILPGKSRPASKPAPKPAATTKAEPAKTEPAKATGEDKPGGKADVKKLAGKPEPKPEAAKLSKPSSSTSGLGGIASLLDSINAPKAKPKPEPEESKEEPIKEETPEEREKRLHKQSRRRLRVSWKGDDELEEVRYFHKEAEEDEGFDSRMTRDAGDDKREGMALKQRGMMMDEDEDEDEDDGIPYRPWLEPTSLDFSSIPAEYRRKTYQPRGGDIVVETDEQKAIAEREQTVLMAIYTDVADIPPTPKSPPVRTVEPSAEMKIGHLPRDDPRFEEVHRRWKEVQQLGRDAALQYAIQRIETKKQSSHKINSTLSRSSTTGPDPRNSLSTMSREDQVLVLLASDRVKQWRSKDPLPATKRRYDYADPRVQHAADLVEDLVPKLNGPYPATEPPAWIRDNPEAVREWWLGYNRDAAAKAKKDADDKARADAEQLAATQNQAGQDAWASYYAQQQQAYAPYMAILQQLQGGQAQASSAPVAQPTQAANNDQLQALLAALGHGQTQGAAAAAAALANAAPQLNPNDPTYQQLIMLSQLAQQPQQPQGEHGGAPAYGTGSGRDWDRERDRDRDRERERDRDRDRDHERDRGDRADRDERRGGHRKHKGALPPHRPVNRALIGTKPCVFYKQGTCARGDQCTFRHE